MTTITEDYVSFETAKLLKEKGFDCETDMYYSPEGELKCWISNGLKLNNKGNETWWWKCVAPTHQMAMKWLREVHNLFIQITVDFSDGAYPMYDVCVVNLAICTSIVVNGYDRYSYKESVDAAIKYCLENLI